MEYVWSYLFSNGYGLAVFGFPYLNISYKSPLTNWQQDGTGCS